MDGKYLTQPLISGDPAAPPSWIRGSWIEIECLKKMWPTGQRCHPGVKLLTFTVMVWLICKCMKFPPRSLRPNEVIRALDAAGSCAETSAGAPAELLYTTKKINNVFIHLHLELGVKVSFLKWEAVGLKIWFLLHFQAATLLQCMIRSAHQLLPTSYDLYTVLQILETFSKSIRWLLFGFWPMLQITAVI